MLDLRTFGDTPAAIILTNKIMEYNIPHRKISRLLCSFNEILNELNKLESRIAINLAHMYYKQITKTQLEEYPIEIRSYLLNVISSSYKKWGEKNDWRTPHKIRKLK